MNTDIELLSSIMEKYSINQSQLAKKLGITRQFLSQIMNGTKGKYVSKKLREKIEALYPKCIKKPDKLTIPDIVDKEFLFYFRTYYKYTQVEISNYLDISSTYYNLLESGEKPISQNVICKLKQLNESPNTVVSSNSSTYPMAKIDYYSSLADINSKASRTLYIDKLLLGDTDYSKCKIIDLKIDSINLNIKILVDTSKTKLEDNKFYLLEINNQVDIYRIKKEKDRIEYIKLFTNDTFYSNFSIHSFGEILSINL